MNPGVRLLLMQVSPTTSPAAPLTPRDLSQMLIWAFVILVMLVAGTYAIVRFSRQFRRTFLRPPAEPTDAADVWRMHRLPDDDETDAGR